VDNDDRYPPKFRAAWKHEFGLDVFSVNHLASLFDRIGNPDKYRPPAGVTLPPSRDVEEFAKSVLHRFVDTLNQSSMSGARDRLGRAVAQSRRQYPPNDALAMLSYVYMVETGRKVDKYELWEEVKERCKYLKIVPPKERTRSRVLERVGLANLKKGRSSRKGARRVR
jgi:hypothetical protein